MSEFATHPDAAMNIALEFHDSEVREIKAVDRGLQVSFSSAYVHHSTGRPGVDPGFGYAQALEMMLGEAVWTGQLHECLGALSHGRVSIEGIRMTSLLPLPYEHTGSVGVELVFANGATLSTSAQSLRVRFQGDPHFIESFAC